VLKSQFQRSLWRYKCTVFPPHKQCQVGPMSAWNRQPDTAYIKPTDFCRVSGNYRPTFGQLDVCTVQPGQYRLSWWPQVGPRSVNLSESGKGRIETSGQPRHYFIGPNLAFRCRQEVYYVSTAATRPCRQPADKSTFCGVGIRNLYQNCAMCIHVLAIIKSKLLNPVQSGSFRMFINQSKGKNTLLFLL